MSLEGQRPISPEALGAAPVADIINELVGTTATLLTKPQGAQALYLVAEKGVFRLRVGDHVADMPAAAYPTTSVTDGSAGVLLRAVGDQQQHLAIPAPNKVTVKGYSADSSLMYYWM
jgi:hypothetical protein